jgi:hypothetical protein
VTFSASEIAKAFKQVTPTLLVVGFFGGLAVALGSAAGSWGVRRLSRGRGHS